jgi:hypothetical protein
MTDIATMLMPAAAPLLWLLVSFTVLVRLARYQKRRLLRCPESGGVAIVEVGEIRTTGEGRGGPALRVKSCQLWPEEQNCQRGCLDRCREGWASYGFDLHALRPFEGRRPKQKS